MLASYSSDLYLFLSLSNDFSKQTYLRSNHSLIITNETLIEEEKNNIFIEDDKLNFEK